MNVRAAAMVLVLAVIGLATPGTASAQVGVLVGLNVANVDFDVSDTSVSVNGDSRTGFVAGLSFNMPIQQMFSVEVDALFAQKGTKFTATESGFTDTAKINLNYVDIPVLAKINVTGSAPVGVHLLAGPSFNFKVSENFDPEDAADSDDSIEKMETALVFGGGVHMGVFRVDLRYGIGLTNIVKDSASDGFITGKNRVFSILVGFGG
jgi:hypothetical protein